MKDTAALFVECALSRNPQPLALVQKDAIAMLHSLGIPAREVRLIER